MFKTKKDPLADPTISKYFDIICGMRNTFLAVGPEATSGNELAKNYLEHFLSGACDEAMLVKALELYNTARSSDYGHNDAERILIQRRKAARNDKTYQLNIHLATRMFCQKEIEIARLEYSRVLEVIKDNVNYEHYSQGLEKMSCSDAAKDIVINENFCDGEPITQKLVLAYLMDDISGRKKNSTYCNLYDPNNDIALVVLKALHFEKYGKNRENYTTVSDDDYKDFVLAVPYYYNFINNHPFDKEKSIEECIEYIKTPKVFYGVYITLKRCKHIEPVDDYFCDYACNLLWKSIASSRSWVNENNEEISDSKNPSDVFNMLRSYFDNNF